MDDTAPHTDIALPAPKQVFWQGVRAILPLLLGVAPFGMIYGVLARQAGIPAGQAQSMSIIIYAGSSQFIAAELFNVHTPALIMIATLFIVNLRHLLYSASVAPYVRELSSKWKLILAYLLTDEIFAVAVTNYQKNYKKGNQHWFLLGAGVIVWTAWQLSTAVGVFLGAVIPESWSLDFALPLTFIALVVPTIKNKQTLVSALVAAVAGVAIFGLPLKLSIIAGTLLGIGAGFLLEPRE